MAKNLWICLVLFLFSLVSPRVVLADWPTYLYNNQHTSQAHFTISGELKEKWMSQNIGGGRVPPAVDKEGNIYLSTDNCGMVALDKNGNQKWCFKSYFASATPLVDDDSNIYYATSVTPYVYALDKNGNQKWAYDLKPSSGSTTAVTMSNDKTTLYIGTDSPLSSILALNLDGTKKWQTTFPYMTGSPYYSSVAVGSDGTLYFGLDIYGKFTAMTSSGVIKWQRFIGSGSTLRPKSPIIGSDGNIYISITADGGDKLYSFDPQGNQRWVYQLPDVVFSGESAIKDNVVYTVNKNNLRAINASNGQLIWTWSVPVTLPTLSNLTSPVLDQEGNIYTIFEGKLYVVSASGALKWSKTFFDPLPSSTFLKSLIIADNDLIYVTHSGPNYTGYIHALGNPQTAKVPVIFIPGIGGSELKTKDTVLWSGLDGHGGTYSHTYPAGEKVWVNKGEVVAFGNDDYFDILRLKNDGQTSETNLELTGEVFTDSYQAAINELINNGYTLNKDLFIYNYDWRKDVSATTPFLDQQIEQIKQQTGHQKIDIVAHSLGGLVARNYISDSSRAQKVHKLVTLGAPLLGTADYVKKLMYGGCLAYEFGPICFSLNPLEAKDVIRNMISGYELAPSQKYYDFYDGSDSDHPLPFMDKRDIDNNGVTGFLNYQQIKTMLTNLGYNTALFTPSEAFHSIDNSLNNTNGVDVSIIAGSGQATTGQIIEDYALNFMGIKIPKTDIRKINGDDTVPLFSASLRDGAKSLSGSAKVYYVNQSHSSLVFNTPAMNLVKNILNNDIAMPDGISLQPFSFKGNALSVHSPVLIHAYDSIGNHTGPLANGDFEAKIPGSSYETLGDAKFIWLPEDGQYNLKFAATNQGSFDFKIKSYENSKNDKIVVYKNIPLTNQTRAETIFDTFSATPPVLQVDEDGNGTTDLQVSPSGIATGSAALDTTAPKTEITLLGDQGANGWYKSDIQVELFASDEASGSGIAKTEFSLDNGQTVQDYNQSFVITTEGTTKIKYRSIDKTGNEEVPKEVEIKIDKTPPEAEIVFKVDTQNFDIKGTDNLSKTQVIQKNGEVLIYDEASNSALLKIEPKDKKRSDKIEINSISYNGKPALKLLFNRFWVHYQFDKKTKKVTVLDQLLYINKQIGIAAKYDPKKNITKISIREPKKKRVIEEKTGMALLKLKTNKGKLETQH